MNRNSWIITILSVMIAFAGTGMYVLQKQTGNPSPNYVLGMMAYGWFFVAYMLINSAAKSYKKRYRGK